MPLCFCHVKEAKTEKLNKYDSVVTSLINNNYNKYLTVGGLVCKMLDYENLSSARVATATIKGKMIEQVRKW